MSTRHPHQTPHETAERHECPELSRLVAQTTYAVAVVAAPRVFARRWDASSPRERRSVLRAVCAILTLLGRSAPDLRGAVIVPPLEIDWVLTLAEELEGALAAATFHGYPSLPAVDIARDLARALGVPEPCVGWDAFDFDESS